MQHDAFARPSLVPCVGLSGWVSDKPKRVNGNVERSGRAAIVASRLISQMFSLPAGQWIAAFDASLAPLRLLRPVRVRQSSLSQSLVRMPPTRLARTHRKLAFS